jgi:hypothetical protein
MPDITLDLDLEWEGNSFEDAFDELEADVTNIVRGLSVDMWHGIVNRTPQSRGRMVVSWSYSLNTPKFEDRSKQAPPYEMKMVRVWSREEGRFKFLDEAYDGVNYLASAFQKGSEPAIRIVNAINAGADELFKLGDEVFISNGVDHGEGAYSGAVEYGEIKLRSVNMPGNAVARTLAQITSSYGEDVPDSAGLRLRGRKISQP